MNNTLAKYYGMFFILSFLSYGIGLSFMDVVQLPDATPDQIIAQGGGIVTGGLLIILIHTLCNIGLLVIMFNMLKAFNQQISHMYLISGLIGTICLIIGAIFLMMSVPVSYYFNEAGEEGGLFFSHLIAITSRFNFYFYQAGMAFWGAGGLCCCYLLYKYKLVPVAFSVWGCVGYVIFIAGTILELFNIPYGIIFSIPGGLFEIVFSLWMIIKGVNNIPVVSPILK